MRYSALYSVAQTALSSKGRPLLPNKIVGPQGAGQPFLMNNDKALLSSYNNQRPMFVQKENASLGRYVSPIEASACNSCGGGTGCDYPNWLTEALNHEGSFMDLNMQASEANGGLPLIFSSHVQNQQAKSEAEQSLLASFLAEQPSWSGLFADWCLTHSLNAKAGSYYRGMREGVAIAENWLHYGCKTEPCLGALMLVDEGALSMSFCLGALTIPFYVKKGEVRSQRIYLGIGVKASEQNQEKRIGMIAVSSANVAAFRIPAGYQPCKEHFKLEQTVWAEEFWQKIQQRQQEEQLSFVAAQQMPALPQEDLANPTHPHEFNPIEFELPVAPDAVNEMPSQPVSGDMQHDVHYPAHYEAYQNEGVATEPNLTHEVEPIGDISVDDHELQRAIEQELMKQNFADFDFDEEVFNFEDLTAFPTPQEHEQTGHHNWTGWQ